MSERLCVVMPVYNEREVLGAVLEKWASALDALGLDYVIRPYNDGSKDDSLAVMRAAASGRPRIEVKDKPNGGHGHTILTGYREAAADGFDWIFQIDSDDEMGPERFGELWARRGDRDFLVGIRDGRVQQLPRKIISFVSRLCVRLFYGKSVWDVNAPYRLMRVSAFAEFFRTIQLTTFAPNVILSGLAARHHLRCYETRVPQHDRTTGEVSIRKWKLLKAACRSFVQTVAFALGSGGFGLPRFCLLMTALWGAFFSGFLLASPLRLALVVLAGIVLWKRRSSVRNWAKGIVDFAGLHPWTSWTVIFLVGTLERFVLAVTFPEIVDQSCFIEGGIGADWPYLWQTAANAAEGIRVVSKSWTVTALYAALIRIVGQNLQAACVLNLLLNFGTGLLLARLGGRWFGRGAGLVAGAMSFCLPYLAMHSLNVATEHLYGLLTVACLLCLDCIWTARSAGAVVVRSVLSGILMWLAVWTRGEGLLLVATGLSAAVLVEGICRARWGRCALVCAALIGVSAFCGLSAVRINERIDGSRTVFCSDDNLWPRLFGANVAQGGVINGDDYKLIYDAYAKDHPQATGTPSTREAAPYIRRETARRWREMPFGTMVRHVLRKEWTDWNWDTMLMRKTSFWRTVVKVVTVPFSALFACCGLAFWCLCALKLVRGESVSPSLMTVPILLFGSVIVLAVAECAVRYAYLFPLLFPLFVAGALAGRRSE